MVVNIASFTLETLSNLKFKELQKLSVQYHVNKRWAKKQELIEKLLAIKDENFQNEESKKENLHYSENEWRDGSLIFQNLKETNDKNCVDRRLTFNIDKTSSEEINGSRLTFTVPQNEKCLINENEEMTRSKGTDENPSRMVNADVGKLIDRRATFTVSPKKKLLPDEIDSRATFDIPQDGKKLFEEIKNDFKKKEKQTGKDTSQSINAIECSLEVKKVGQKSMFGAAQKDKATSNINSSQVEMLTIPCTRVLRRNKKDQQNLKPDESPIRMSRKSIIIKKSKLPSKLDLIKSPRLIKKPIAGEPVHIQPQKKSESKKNLPSKIPTSLNFSEKKSDMIKTEEDKENLRNILRRRKSRTADEVLSKKSVGPKVSFMSPPASSIRKNPIKKDMVNNTPGKSSQSLNSSKIVTKPITATKMPNFKKIHQKQFEQMDSLQDYLKKKEERAKKLFGTPQQGIQAKFGNVTLSSRVFKFQSSTTNPENEISKSNKNLKNIKTNQNETCKSKLPPAKNHMDIKEKNRSHIHGVRTNKRFELQMKLRNM